MSFTQDKVLDQIDSALSEWNKLKEKSKHKDCSDQPESEAIRITNRLASAIDRLAPSGSEHKRSLQRILSSGGHRYYHLQPLAGALQALRDEYELGYLQTVEEMVHADTFADFLGMAGHLHDTGYKDAAAVITGSVLEQHLRELCRQNQIEPADDKGRFRPAAALNEALVAKGTYNKLDQRSVASWLSLRNDAAHGNYGAYEATQVRLMMDGIRDFVTRNPA